jgi:hypothetical protein
LRERKFWENTLESGNVRFLARLFLGSGVMTGTG